MINLTPLKLQDYVKDYDYNITLNQAKEILELLDNVYGTFKSDDIQMATDYIIYGKNSMFAYYFE